MNRHLALRVLGVGVVLLAAEAFTRSGLTQPQYVPYASTVLERIGQLLTSTEFLAQLWVTIKAWLAGLALATIVGTALGFAIGLSVFARRSSQSLFDLIRPIPSVALIPLGVLVLGQGLGLKITLAVYGAAWPMLYNVAAAMREMDKVQIDTADIFRVGALRKFTRVFLPSTLPYISTGIRVASPIALIIVISVEMLGGARAGLGVWLLEVNEGAGRADLVFAGTAIAGLLGALSNWLLAVAERRILRWHPSHRKAAAARA